MWLLELARPGMVSWSRWYLSSYQDVQWSWGEGTRFREQRLS